MLISRCLNLFIIPSLAAAFANNVTLLTVCTIPLFSVLYSSATSLIISPPHPGLPVFLLHTTTSPFQPTTFSAPVTQLSRISSLRTTTIAPYLLPTRYSAHDLILILMGRAFRLQMAERCLGKAFIHTSP